MPIYTQSMFVGRENEFKIIQEAVASNRAEFGIVYGRRRIGKSALLMQFKKHKSDLYFEALQKVSTLKQIDHFTDQLARETHTPKILARNWKEAFDGLTPHIQRGRHYIVFDEFPWMASGRTELVSILKFYWDMIWKKNPKLTLVLCGSVTSFMLKHLIHSQALHNRKTFEIKLEPLPANEAALFFKKYRSNFEMAKFLMVFGGIPKYLEQLDPTQSFTSNMDRLCFTKNSFFMTEFETLFKEQFKVIKTYETIAEALAKHSDSKEGLAERIQMKPGGGLSGYIQALEQADFVKVFSPLSIRGGGEKTKKIVLWDEWLRFYFSYLKPNKHVIEMNTKPGLFQQLAGKSIDTYFGLAFERLCMKNLPGLLSAAGIPLNEILGYGPFFRQPARKKGSKDVGLQIDILVHRQGHVLTVMECKFLTSPIGLSIVQDVERKVAFLKPKKFYTVEKMLVCTGPITRDLQQSGYFHKILDLDALFASKAKSGCP
ncbi:MAG: AAA family ATPase [Chlamydiae bacterium]|nr:AAA family ATPase [Chlamydiota bacterium]